ncbi:hypothetical protein CN13_09595 [Petrotoga sp. HKA.pet.4.5]|nr:hypothetical protein CN13_09595 [Petrotoga sp. HKA.pet.4.5]
MHYPFNNFQFIHSAENILVVEGSFRYVQKKKKLKEGIKILKFLKNCSIICMKILSAKGKILVQGRARNKKITWRCINYED